jgi:hypothetical protein
MFDGTMHPAVPVAKARSTGVFDVGVLGAGDRY